MSDLSPRAQRMLTRWKGPADPTLAAPLLRTLLAERGAPVPEAWIALEERFGGRRYAVFGDPAERALGIAQQWRAGDKRPQVQLQRTDSAGWIAQCVRIGAKPERPLCVDESGAVVDAGLKLPAIGDPHPFSHSIETLLEWDAIVDEIESLPGEWHVVRAQGPDGLARSVAERLGVPPVTAASGAHLGAWADERVRLRFAKGYRMFEPRPIAFEAWASSLALAEEIAAIAGALLARPPVVAPYPAPGYARVERVR